MAANHRQQEALVAQGVRAMLSTVLRDIQAPQEDKQLQGLKALQGLARNASMFLPMQAAFREAGGFPLLVKLIDAAIAPLLQRQPHCRRMPQGSRDILEKNGPVMDAHIADDVSAGHISALDQHQPHVTNSSGENSPNLSCSDIQHPAGTTQQDAHQLRQAGNSMAGVPSPDGEDWAKGPRRVAPAVEALAVLARNNPKNRAAAIQAGAVPSLCAVLEAGASQRVPVALDDVLRALYALAASDSSGHSTTELFASGGVHSLVRLLGGVLERSGNSPQCRVWARELVELLAPLAARSRIVAALLLSELTVFVRLLSTLDDPLTLSLGLDVLEELVQGLGTRARSALVAGGGLSPLVRLLHMGGLGSKAAVLLATVVTGLGPAPLRALRALLKPADLAALVHIALMASHAKDLDAEACRQLLEGLVGGGDLNVAKCLVLSRDCGPCLSMPGVAPLLADRLASEEGALLIASIGAEHALEAALACAELLPHRPVPAAAALLGGNRARVLVTAALEEVTAGSTPGRASSAAAVGGLPIDDGGDDFVRALAETMQYLMRLPVSNSSPHLEVQTPPAPAVLEATPTAVNAKAHADGKQLMTFVVQGEEITARRGVMESASPVVAAAVAGMEDVRATKVIVPPIPGLAPERAPDTFRLALRIFAGEAAEIPAEQTVDLWLLGVTMKLQAVQLAAEAALPAALKQQPPLLHEACAAADPSTPAGTVMGAIIAAHVGRHMGALLSDGQLAAVAGEWGHVLSDALLTLLIARLQVLAPRAMSRSSSACTFNRAGSFLSTGSFSEAIAGFMPRGGGAGGSTLPSRAPSHSIDFSSIGGSEHGAPSSVPSLQPTSPLSDRRGLSSTSPPSVITHGGRLASFGNGPSLGTAFHQSTELTTSSQLPRPFAPIAAGPRDVNRAATSQGSQAGLRSSLDQENSRGKRDRTEVLNHLANALGT